MSWPWNTARVSSERGVPTMMEFIYHYVSKIGREE